MRNVYSAVLAAARGLAGDSAVLAPAAGQIWVLRDITLWNGNTGPIVDASITTYAGITIWSSSWTATPGLVHEEGRWVINQGSWIQMHATFPVDFWLSGYVLDLP